MAPIKIPTKPVDVVIIGAGPAGMMASVCCNTFGLKVLHLDERETITKAGRADGIQPRTLEVLRNISGINPKTSESMAFEHGKNTLFAGPGLAKTMVNQGVRVYEVAFWDPTSTEKLARTSRAASCPDFVDVVDNYTLLLHQGLIEEAFLNEIENRRQYLQPEEMVPAPYGGVFREHKFVSCKTLDPSHDELAKEYPVEVVVENVANHQQSTVRSKYLFGLDGARSQVRKCVAGGGDGDGEWKGKITMQGEGTDIIWGVMDARVRTNFPDLKYKCLIHSRDAGSIMVIPREAGLVRFYVQLQAGADRNKQTQDICIETAKKIFDPYHLEFGYVDWFSVYQIGQRIASNYTLDERVFLGGDATHTHSPKAGQGMNISMLDMYSLAWKINLVEKGLGKREILLPTYEQERRGIAQELLKFDAEYSRLFSGRAPTSEQLTTDPTKAAKSANAVDADRFIAVFKKNAFFTSGCGAIYFQNALNALPDAEIVSKSKYGSAFNPKGCKLLAGQRLLPGKAVRCEDANQIRIQQEVKMNGAFRIHVLAGQLDKTRKSLEAFGQYIDSADSFYNRHRPAKGVYSSIVDALANGDSTHEIMLSQHKLNPFFTFLTIVATHYYEWDIHELPSPFGLYRSQVYSDSIFDRRVQEAGTSAPLHKKYGINESEGAIIAVRPDGYVGAIVPLKEEGWLALADYFDAFLVRNSQKASL